MEVLATVGPGVDLDVSGSTNPLEPIDTGELDLASGAMMEMRSGHSEMKLFDHDFVCMARKGHPALRARLTLRRYPPDPHPAP